jgi:hypothetical protein
VKWESVFNSVVGGEIKNGYSKGDWILAWLYQKSFV